MKIAIVLLLSLFLTLHAQTAGPTVISISGDPSKVSTPVHSSLRGGRLVYINVIGHDPMA
jgi:hypothetical protein